MYMVTIYVWSTNQPKQVTVKICTVSKHDDKRKVLFNSDYNNRNNNKYYRGQINNNNNDNNNQYYHQQISPLPQIS